MDVVSLNNLGVALFLQRSYVSSAELFRGALQATLSELQGSQSCTSPPLDLSTLPVANTMETPPNAPITNMNAYSRAINLLPAGVSYAEDTLVNTTIVSSICLFNLALGKSALLQPLRQSFCIPFKQRTILTFADRSVYHIRGLEGFDGSSQACLLKSRSLYLKAKGLLIDAGLTFEVSTGHPLLDILQMAILNNLGQSSYFLADYEQSKLEFQSLLQMSGTLRSRMDDPLDGENAALVEFHKSLFLGNAAALSSPPLLAPAA